jgi:hypothetical protein
VSVAKTKAKQALTGTKPKQDFNAIGQLGLKAQQLAVANAVAIGTRLSAAFLSGFASDIASLPSQVPTAITTHDGQVQLTAAQATALQSGYKLVKGIRTTVKGAEPSKDVLVAYGIGTRTSPQLVKDVTSAIQKILNRVAAEPTEAAGFDIVQADVTALTAALAKITQADTAQEAGRAAAPQTTAQRNATGRRILAGVRKVAGAGMRTFPDDATLYASFEGLVSKKAG